MSFFIVGCWERFEFGIKSGYESTILVIVEYDDGIKLAHAIGPFGAVLSRDIPSQERTPKVLYIVIDGTLEFTCTWADIQDQVNWRKKGLKWIYIRPEGCTMVDDQEIQSIQRELPPGVFLDEVPNWVERYLKASEEEGEAGRGQAGNRVRP